MVESTGDVLAANLAFYGAFEARDLDAMADLWDHGDDVACTHPGWPTLHGWSKVGASWAALLSNGERLQFIVADELVRVCGPVAWVACTENVLAEDGFGGTIAALNVFEQREDGWVIVAHHGSAVARKV